MSKPLLEAQKLTASYRMGASRFQVLKEVDFRLERGDWAAIQGPSGSGKSTLFYLLGGMLKPDSGKILLADADITQLSERDLAHLRNHRVGFVFQQFHLLARASVLENVLLPVHYPCEIAPQDTASMKAAQVKARALCERLGLGAHLEHLPNQLSGGQQQRVAIARALMNDPELILADEPTGNLDSKSAVQILDLFAELNREGRTLVIITHDSEVARRCSKIFHLRDGQFVQTEGEGVNHANVQTSATSTSLKVSSSPGWREDLRTLRAVLPLAWDNLFRNKVKSLLTMLGVVIGVGAVLAMVTLGSFTQKKILEGYEAMGVNQLLVRGWPNWELKATDKLQISFRGFDLDKDLMPLKRIFPEVARLSPVMHEWQTELTVGGMSFSEGVRLFGISEEYLPIMNRTVLHGRALTSFHINNRDSVCLIGTDIVSRLFRNSDPVGQLVTVTVSQRRSFACKIIGVLSPQVSNQEWLKPNLQVWVPHTVFKSMANWWGQMITQFVVQIETGQDVENAAKKIRAYFEKKYGKAGRFYVDEDSTLVAQMKKFLALFSGLLASIALLSLLVGGIGINNMMLVSVNDRLKEFGLRKALGATNRSIRLQVLLESVLLCGLAGILGVLLGFLAYESLIYGATHFVSKLKFEWILEPLAILLSSVSVVAVGILSGLAPAVKAERLQVIEALRAE